MSRAASKPFLYVASKRGGGTSFGMRRARNTRALADGLRGDRMTLTRSFELPAWAAMDSAVSLKDQAAMNEQLAALVGRGVPLVDALEVVKSVVSSGQGARVERIRDLVSSGSSFADSCAKAGGFDRVTVAVYRAAEKTGDLAEAARQLAVTARRRLAVSGKAATLAVYPCIVMTVGLLAGLTLLVFVVPMVGRALASGGLELPAVTQITMGTGLWIRANAGLLVLGLAGLGVLAFGLRGLLGRAFGSIARRTPLLSNVLLTQELVRFFSVMAAMSRSGVPLADALGVSTGAVGHSKLRAELTRLRTRLVQGRVLTDLIDEVGSLPYSTRRLLVAAEKAGDLESAFIALSEDMTEDLDKQTARLLAALEPLLLVVLFVIVGGLMVTVMLPMLTLAANQL